MAVQTTAKAEMLLPLPDATGGEGVDLRPGERLETREGAGEERPSVTTGDVEREGEASRVKVRTRLRGVR